MKIKVFSLIFVISIIIAAGQTPVQIHGQLKVTGNKIVDQQGNVTQLRGMSFFWSQWMGNFYNKLAVNWLVEDWKVTVVRAAMGAKHVESHSGYIYDGSEKEKIIEVVDASIRKGIYVIIDWHDHYAFDNVKDAKRFFEDMAKRYGKYPNVIYEIFNEPVKVSWSEVVKPYAETIIEAIRKIDPDNLIIVGTPSWCQNVDEAAKDPLKGENIVYALHFYAATHGEDVREKARIALNAGIPLFVSEFGTCLASGNGFLDSAETEVWFKFMDQHSLSWCNWSVADKNETASALLPGTRTTGSWRIEHLTQSGKIIRHKLRMYAGIKEPFEPVKKKKDKPGFFKFKPIGP